MAAVEQPVDQLNRKLESMKIDAHRKSCEMLEVPVSKDGSTRLEQTQPSPPSESLNSSGSISSSEATGDAASSYGSRDEFTELAYITAPNGFVSPHGTIYAGSPAPVMNMHGYMPYSMDGVHFHNPVMDYSYVNQPYCGSLSSGIQYSTPGNNGYLYGPQVFQYPPQPYYQQAPGGQYLSAPSGLPAGGVMMLDSQDPGRPGVVMSTGFTSINPYAGPIPGFPVTMMPPPVPCEKGAIPVAVTYAPPHTLRASAPAWIEPPAKPKGLQRQGNPTPVVSQSNSSANFVPPTKSSSLNPPVMNGTLPKSCLPSAAAPANHNNIGTPDSGGIPNGVDAKPNGGSVDDTKQQGKGNGSVNNHCGSLDTFYEQNKDAWASKVRSQHMAPILKSLKGPCGSLNKDLGTCLPNGEQYNRADFVTKYDDARHFIIKSYSEDNVHKSIQYSVWASTPNGNKKLDEAYQDAQRRAGGKPRGCPVFLFFSVNGSRQFCGLAEMIGPVDYSRTMEFWEQHKWSGSFPVKWHIIKDVPNSQLRRIILENNENKPVTNSRDTQEVNYQQGLEMLNIFKSYPARTSILDEFPVYPNSQKAVQDVKPRQWSPQCFPKIGEQVNKERDESDGLKTGKLSATATATATAPKICDNGPKPKEVNCQEKSEIKPVHGKASETAGQDARVDKEKMKLDKENIKMPNKEERSMVPA